MLGVWVVSKCGKGKEIYIFSYFGMFSDYLRDFEVFFFCLLGVWVLRKCGKVKRNWLFLFLVSDLFGSKKLEATENRPN